MIKPEDYKSLLDFNTLAIDVNCRYFFEVTRAEDIPVAIAFAEQQQLPWLVLGGGSNLVFTRDFPGVIIKNALRGVQYQARDECVLLTAASGESWHSLVMDSLAQGYCGLENLALIPGSVGAAAVQNIGAYGVELEQRLESVTLWNNRSKNWQHLTKAECQFGYRDSIFKHALKDCSVITEMRLQLHKQAIVNTRYAALNERLAQHGIDSATPQQVAATVIEIRQEKLPDPEQLPNAGSFFKNPVIAQSHYQHLLSAHPQLPCYPASADQVKVPAGWLLEQAGWKGRSQGHFAMHNAQALVLVHLGGGSGTELLAFAEQIKDDINHRFSIKLEIEPSVY